MNGTEKRSWDRPASSDPGAAEGEAFATPRRVYGRRNGSASRRERFLVALTPQGARNSGALVKRDGILVYVRKVDSARHMLRLPEPSWAVDEEKLYEAQAEGADRVEIHDETGSVWWASIAYFLERGQRFDRGWGAQVRLPLSHFSFLPANSVTLQPRLFAEAGR